jgi:hypothetical protein
MMIRKNGYEKILLKEVRGMPKASLQHVIQILRIYKTAFPVSSRNNKTGQVKTGICGIWNDKRSSVEIIEDIYSHRTGFKGRKISL